jgi:acyl carrier protein
MTNTRRLLASPDVVRQTAPERAVAEIIVSALKLDLHPSDIRPETRLIGGGLGLKAIDILDVALCICRTYGFEAGLDDVSYHEIFASLRSLAAYVEAHGTRRRITRGVKHLAQSVAFFCCGSATLH